MENIAKGNFASWASAVRDKDIERIVSLYAQDATFLPTLSAEFKLGPSGAREYFRIFLKNNPVGKIIDDAVQELGENSYLHSGFYDFEMDNEAGTARIVARARFTLVWKREPTGDWKIIHHHSSLMPD